MKTLIISIILLASKTTFAQQIVYESMLIKNDGVYKLNNVAYSGEVIYLNSKGQITSRYAMIEGKPKGIYTAYFEEPDFKKNKFQDSSMVRFLKDSINITEKGLKTLLEDSLICHNNLSDYILNEMGGEKKLLKLQEKYEDNKLKRKALEKWNVYNVLLNSLIFKGREIISCQDRLNNIKSNLNNEIKKPLYQPIIKEKFDQHEFVKSGFYNEFYYSQKIKAVGTYSNDLQNGSWTYYYENGTKAAEGTFINGGNKDSEFICLDLEIPRNGRNGKWMLYFANGNISGTSNYANGWRNGECNFYDENGIILLTENYKNGTFEGLRIEYFPNGNPKEISHYKDGKLNGAFVTFDLNQIKTRECSFKDGKIDGLELFVNPNGKKISETYYSLGIKNGKEKLYFESGKIKEENTYVNGKQVGLQLVFFENGKKKKEEIKHNGKLHGYFKTYYENGKLESSGSTDSLSRAEGYLIGNICYYKPDGSLKSINLAHNDGSYEDVTPVNINYTELNKPYKCMCCKKTINGILDAYLPYDQAFGEGNTMKEIKKTVKQASIPGSFTSKFLDQMEYKSVYDYFRRFEYSCCTRKCYKLCH